MKTNTSSRQFKNKQSGSALVYALLISVFGVVLVTSLGAYFDGLGKRVLINNEAGALRAALHSSMDYTLNGIRNRWCFTNNWSPNSTCLLTNPNNVERLLISDEAIRAIEASMPAASYGGVISGVRTKSISGTVNWADITPEHPLYYVIQSLKDIGTDFAFNFKIIRSDAGVQKGREVALQVEVELVLGAQSFFKTKSNVISAVSSIMVFPREVNTNALLIGQNLFLDRPDPGIASADNGNVYISPVLDLTTQGIHFESPVFVNGNIYIPNAGTPGYTPVTFADKVIIGGGAVLQGSGFTATYSKPSTAGGLDDRFYSQTEKFGGFLRGILLDPGTDEGLRVLTKVAAPTGPATPSSELCILRNSAKANLSVTRDSQLFMKPLSASFVEPSISTTTNVTSSYSFVANLGSIDNFYRQSVTGGVQFNTSSPSTLNSVINYLGIVSDQRPIMRVTIALNGMQNNPNAFLTADLSSNAVVEIPMNSGDPTAVLRITTSPYVVGANTQANAANIKIDLINQEKFALLPYPVKLGGSTITSSAEPSIDVNIEAFDVAYTTSSSGVISSGRIKGSPADPVTAAECVPGSFEYITDVKTIDGIVHHCYSQYSWHPKLGKYKSNGFSLKREPGGVDKRFVLVRDPAALGVAGGYFTCPAYDSTCLVHSTDAVPQEVDWVAFDQNCFTPPAGTDLFPSFVASDWANSSFTQQARRSWGFTEQGTSENPGFNSGTLLLDSTSARFDGVIKPTFIVAAIYSKCLIKEDANFVTGFFVCDDLTIEARSTPLRIIGSFIVSRMSIDPEAINAGIRWSNIYHPSAVTELRRAGVLNPSGDISESCDVAAEPLWHPYPSIKRAQFQFKCNSISLRNKADPFKWTMADPDCGLDGGKQSCKYRALRFEIIEMKRQEFL